MRYAQKTKVSANKSKQEIESLLLKHGATNFASASSIDKSMIMLFLNGRKIRFVLTFYDKEYYKFTEGKRARRRTPSQIEVAYQQAYLQKWRALLLLIKAKLEASLGDIVAFEEEFLPYTVLPSGRTVAEETLPMIAEQYESGKVSPLLLS